ncbi:hypothetical protein [Flavobacterium croceum]|uniref:hypothetical protein n=1 Tax=Flavobacterium croceum TaxID=370975 RepID=UPI000CDAEA33|nr:hypothetical protein [Flavobacterium croceum]
MKYLNITKYIYLIAGVLMAIEAYTQWNDTSKRWIYVGFSCMAFFLFYFRHRFSKNQSHYNHNNKSS